MALITLLSILIDMINDWIIEEKDICISVSIYDISMFMQNEVFKQSKEGKIELVQKIKINEFIHFR